MSMSGKGTVKLFKEDKGFGFVTLKEPCDKNEEVFVHFTAIANQADGHKLLLPGQSVDITYENSDKGLRATYVIVTDTPPESKNYQHNNYGRGGYRGGYGQQQRYNQGYGNRGGYGRGGYGRGSYGYDDY